MSSRSTGWREALEGALRDGFAAQHQGLVPFLSLYAHQRLVGYARFVERAQTVPGVIVEVGVGCGDSLVAMAMQEEVLHPHEHHHARVFGFDNGEGFPEISERDNGPDIRADRVIGGYGAPAQLSHVRQAIELLEQQRRERGARHPLIELIVGDARETVPRFAARYNRGGADRSSLPIKLLHLDVDLYEPTLTALEHLGPLLVPGAIVVLDEWNWGREDFPGEIRAVREYFGGNLPQIQRDRWVQPGGWFVVTPELAGYMHERR
jgi:Methyltransferase domain